MAREKVKALGLEAQIRLYVGDATRLDLLPDGGTQSPAHGGRVFTKVISLDSAYHFNTRRAFLAQARERLVEGDGSRICLADMFMWHRPTSLIGRILLKVACAGTHIPEGNLVEEGEYRKTLESAGFREVQMEFIEHHVFIGLARFLGRHEKEIGDLTRPNLWMRYRVTGAVLKALHDYKVLRYAIVTAAVC